MNEKAIRVTAEDLETGERGQTDIWDDYVIVTAGSCHVSSVTAQGSTIQLTIKGVKRASRKAAGK